MIEFYYAPGACSLASHIALREGGAQFTARRLNLAEGDQRRPEYLAVNPHGRVPALVVDGTTLTENPAILGYVARRFGVGPADGLAAARVDELTAFCASSVHIAFAQLWRPIRFTADEALHPAIQAAGREALARYFAEIETTLAAGDWYAGAHSVADGYPLVFYRWGRRIGLDMAAHAAWTRHTARMLTRPAVAAAIAAEGLSANDWGGASAQ